MREWNETKPNSGREPKEFCEPKSNKKKEPKDFGIIANGRIYYKWFATAKKRDESLASLERKGYGGPFRPIDKATRGVYYKTEWVGYVDVFVSNAVVICPKSRYETKLTNDKVIIYPSDLYHARKAGLKKIFGIEI